MGKRRNKRKLTVQGTRNEVPHNRAGILYTSAKQFVFFLWVFHVEKTTLSSSVIA